MIYFINDPARTEVLSETLKVWALVLGIDLCHFYFVLHLAAAGES